MDLCLKANSVYTNGQSQCELLWRTLIKDQMNGLCPTPLQFAMQFHNLLLNDAKCALQEAKESESDFARLRSRYQCWELFAQSSLGVEVPTLAKIDGRALEVEEIFERDIPEEVSNLDQTLHFCFALSKNSQRRLFRTESNLLGLCPRSSQVGDSTWLLRNTKVFHVLRLVEGTEHYKLVGEAYLHRFIHSKIEAISL